jgi:hypothetical protein
VSSNLTASAKGLGKSTDYKGIQKYAAFDPANSLICVFGWLAHYVVFVKRRAWRY